MKARGFLKICEDSAGGLLKEYIDTARKNAKKFDEFYEFIIKETPKIFPNAPYKQINQFGKSIMYAAYPLLYANNVFWSFPEALFNYAKKSID